MTRKMNKNGGKKLLAAIAVFAMVFALASVVVNTAVVEDSDAEVPTSNISGTLTELKQESASSIAAGDYYVVGNITGAKATGVVNIYLVNGGSVKFASDTGTDVNVYLAADGSTTTAPTKSVSGVVYDVQVSGSAKATDIYGDLSLEVITETGTNASADFKMTVSGGDPSVTAYYLFSKVASIDLPKDTTGYTFIIDHKAGLQDASVTVSQMDGEIVKNVVSAIPGSSAGSFTVANTYVAEPLKYTMIISDASNVSSIEVIQGSAITPDAIATIGAKSDAITTTVAASSVWFASLEDLAVRNVLPVADYTVIGSQTIEGTITLPASANVVLEAATDVLIVKGTLNNLGTIGGTSGKLVNYGTINNGRAASEGVEASAGSISVAFENGKDHTGTLGESDYVAPIPGEFNNYYTSTITSGTISNSERSSFTNYAGTSSLAIDFKEVTNKGTFVNEGYMSINVSNKFVNEAFFTNNGTLTVNGILQGAVDSASTADNIAKLVSSKLINNGTVTFTKADGAAIFIDDNNKGTVSFTSPGTPKDGYYVAKKTEGSAVEYAFWGDEYVLTLSAATTTDGDCITAGIMIDADGYIELIANTTKSQFILTANGDEIKYAVGASTVLKAGTADGTGNSNLNMYASSVKVVSLGEDLTVPEKKSVELAGQVLTKNINLVGVAIIPSDSTITFADGGRILLTAGSILNVYGDLINRNVDSKIDISFPNNVTSKTIVYSPNADISAFIVVPSGVVNAKFINDTGVTISTSAGADISTVVSSDPNLKTVIEQAKTIYIRGTVAFSSTMFKDGLDLSDKTIMFATAESTLELTGITVTGGDFAGYVAPGAAEGAAPVVGTIVIKNTVVSAEVTLDSATFDGTVFSNVKIKTTAGTDATSVTVAFVGVTADTVTITYGSFIINGTLDLDSPADVAAIQSAVTANQVVILQDVTITGNGTIDISKLEIAGEVSVGENVIIDIDTGYTLKVDSTAKITGAGKINVKDAAGLTIETGAEVTEGIIIAVGDLKTYVSSQAELIAKYDIYNTFIINADDFELTDTVAEALTIGKKTIVLNGYDLTIVGEVIFDETTVVGDDDSKLIVATGNAASLTLNKANVYATVEDKDENITIKSALVSGWDTDSADTIKVGYGNTLNMKSVNIVSGKVITVYGILNIEGTTTVNPGASVIIKNGAVANNSGTLTILGKELEGSVVVEGTLNNTGSIVVGDNNGYATMVVSGKVFLKDGSSLNVKVAKSADKLDDNYLAGTGAVTVDAGATLTVNGTISVESVYLKGTLGMNGTAAGTTVYLYDGVSVAVTSVTGTISFSDKYVVDEDALDDDGVRKQNVIYSDGNKVTLTNVKGVVVSESVKAGSVKIDEDNYKTYVCGLTISGVVSAIKDTYGSIEINNSAALYPSTVSSYVTAGKVTVGDMALGKKVTLSTNGKVTVSGNLTAVEEDAEIFIGSTSKDMVTVTGLITCLDFELDGNLSAAMYSIHDTEKATETYYYTTFVAAVDAAPTAYENTVVLYGKITVSSGITIAKPIVIELDSSAKVTIKGTADVIIDNGAKLDGSAGEITVTGTLKIVDKDSGIVEPVKEKFNYEVLLTDDADKQVVIYAGLIGVLKNAEAGQTVTMQKSATISEDIEIKEGVTLVVPEKLTLFIGDKKDDVTVTVNGTIQVEKRAYIVPAEDVKKVTIIANGVISSYDDKEFNDFKALNTTEVQKFVMTDFAYFNIDQKVYYWSNLTYAAENCHEGEIEVTGQLTAGDIVFTEDEKATEELVVKVVTPEGAKVYTNVYATSITLDGATLMVDQKSKISTTVKGASLSGDASVILEGASTVFVISYYDEVKEENHLYIAGAPTGNITIAAGNVEVGDLDTSIPTEDLTIDLGLVIFANEERVVEFTIADGATLTVPKDVSLITFDYEGSDVIIVEGTLAVKNGGEAYLVNMYLAGTMAVESKVVYIIDSTIAGTLDVKEKTETTEEGLVYLDMVFVGDEPRSLGANGTVIGNIKVDNGDWFYVFNGSDVSKAKINYNIAEQKNDIKTTVVNINGDDVVTIYAYGSVDVYDALDAAEIELIGLETPAFDSTTKMYSAPTLKTEDLISDAANVKVGKYTNVYLDFALVGIHGMISQGQGVILMIDGNTIDNYRASIYGGDYVLSVGTYKVTYEPAYGYEDKGIKITFNGSVVTDGKITITADMKTFALTVSDATPADPVTPITPVDPSQPEKDDGMGITEYLLIVLVILAAILVVVVAIRMMRN